MPLLLLAGLGLALALAPPLPLRSAQTPAAGAEEEASLERLLGRLRVRRRQSHAALTHRVGELVARLERGGQRRQDPRANSIRANLEALGPEAAVLLLEHLDPGQAPSDGALFRARQVRQVMLRLNSEALTEQLVRLAQSASPIARQHAAHLLGFGDASDPVTSVLAEAYGQGESALRIEAGIALTRLGGEQQLVFLRQALLDSEPSVARALLTAVARDHNLDCATAVMSVIRHPLRAASLLSELIAYYRHCPEVLDAGVVDGLVGLATNDALGEAPRIQVLEALTRYEPATMNAHRKRIGKLRDAYDGGLGDATLLLLARLGDNSARRQLLRELDTRISRNRSYPPAHEERGDMLLRLRDYLDAARDYKSSIELVEKGQRDASTDIRIKLARAYVLGGKLRNAQLALEEARLSRRALGELALDPDFAALRESSRFGRVFE